MTVNDQSVSALAVARPPGPDTGPRRIDHAAVERAARDLLRAVGADVDAEALVAGMNVNVWDVTDPIKRLIGERVAVDDRRLADPDVTLDQLACGARGGVA
jgi:hypothetical protein